MKAWRRLSGLLALVMVAGPVAAEEAGLPPGHPPLTADRGESGGRARPVPAPQASGRPSAARPAHAGRDHGTPPQDVSVASPELPPRTVEARIRDGAGQPMAGMDVRLGILRQDVGEGETRETRTVRTDEHGVARFADLPTGTAFSFRTTVEKDGATYASSPFQLREAMGHSVVLHVFPVTRNIKEALVGARALLFVQPRHELFQFEVTFQFFNVGRVTWVPRDVTLRLPDGWKGFSAVDGMSDIRVERSGGDGIRLSGTFSPGQQDVSFRFQVPNQGDSTQSFELPLPPHVAEARVFAERVPGLELGVAGFPEAQVVPGQDGSKILFTARQVAPGQGQLERLSIHLDGIPVPGRGRRYATFLAAAIALYGLYRALLERRPGRTAAISTDDARRARELLLDELVELERLRREDQVGPRTYEQTRTALLDALARLDATDAASPGTPAPAH